MTWVPAREALEGIAMDHTHEEQVRTKAFELWLQNGCPQGTAERDWLEAERLVSAATPPPAGQRRGKARPAAGPKSPAAKATPRASAARAQQSAPSHPEPLPSRPVGDPVELPKPDARPGLVRLPRRRAPKPGLVRIRERG